jgi:hypothetical protein
MTTLVADYRKRQARLRVPGESLDVVLSWIVGGLLIASGAAMPWAHVEAGFDLSGMHSWVGVVALAVGLSVAAAAPGLYSRLIPVRAGAAVLASAGAAAVGVAVYAIVRLTVVFHAQAQTSHSDASNPLQASFDKAFQLHVSYGLYVIAGGGLLVLAASAVALTRRF